MNTYTINSDYIKSEEYKNYLKINNSIGYLSIRAYSANEAIPVKGLRITVTNTIGNNNVIFLKEKLTNQV